MPPVPLPRRLMFSVMVTILLCAGASTWGFLAALSMDAQVRSLRSDSSDARRLLTAAVEAENALRGYMIYGTQEFVTRFERAASLIESEEGRRIVATIDAARGETVSLTIEGLLESFVTGRRNAISDIAEGRREAVIERGRRIGVRRPMDLIGEAVSRFTALRGRQAEALGARLELVQTVVEILVLGTALVTVAALLWCWTLIRRRSAAAEEATRDLGRRSEEIAALLGTSEMLQSCQTAEDIETVVTHAGREVLPSASGALYVFSNSRDRLDRGAVWAAVGEAEAPRHVDHFSAKDCWALKRGRPHCCGGGGPACEHARENPGALCVPMAARGEVYGVLQFTGPSVTRLGGPGASLAGALADGVSMALANLSLREKLRGQALRDPLTGLYNRRFLEEMTERLAAQAERRKSPLAVAMLDVDHFKKVNDEHGHAAGDAVLRALGATMLASVRRSDIACRYGGEELLLLLPDCGMNDARDRVEDIRRRVAAMNDGPDNRLPRVTISAGIATLPDCATTISQAIHLADEALYAAKRGGRNQVRLAEPIVQQDPEPPAEAPSIAPPGGGLRLIETATAS